MQLRLPRIHVSTPDGLFERSPERGQIVLALTSRLEEVVTYRSAAGRMADLEAVPALSFRRRPSQQEFRIVKRDRVGHGRAVEIRL